MNVASFAPVGAPTPFPTGWLPGAGTVPLASVLTFGWEHFTAAERLACDLRAKDHTVHVVSYPEGDGCAMICPATDAAAVVTSLNALLPRPPHAPDRSPARQPRERKMGKEALFALFHVRGLQWHRQTGSDWNTERAARIEELLGHAESSTRLGYDHLSILVDQLTADLTEAGFDVEAENADYRARTAQASARQAAPRPASSRRLPAPGADSPTDR